MIDLIVAAYTAVIDWCEHLSLLQQMLLGGLLFYVAHVLIAPPPREQRDAREPMDRP